MMREKVTTGFLIAVVVISALSISLYNIYKHREINTDLHGEETDANIIFRIGSSSSKHSEELDTFKGTLTKDTGEGSVITDLDLTQEEIDSIHLLLNEIDFFTYPTTYPPKHEGDTYTLRTSFTVYSLEFRNETTRKFVYWTHLTSTEDAKYQNLMDLATLIVEMIQIKLTRPTV